MARSGPIMCVALAVAGLGIGLAPAPRAAPVDRSVDVGGYRLHLQCRGEGSPAVVLDTGIGETFRTWERILEAASARTTACGYDRAGYGDSEAGPLPRSAGQSAVELVALLKRAGVPSPYVLVGHSLGAANAMVLAAGYPELVGGLVLVDPPPLGFLGGERFPHLSRMAEEQTREFERQATEHREAGRTAAAAFFQTLASEHEMLFGRTAERLARIDDLGEIPLIVIGAGRPNPAFGDVAGEFQAFWIEESREVATLSGRGKFVLAENAGHHVHLDEPDVVIEAIDGLMDTLAPISGGSRRSRPDSTTSDRAVSGELLLFLLFGLPVGAAIWFWAAELAEIVQHNMSRFQPTHDVRRDRPPGPGGGLSPDWQTGVATARSKTDVRVIRVAVTVLILLWAAHLAWQLVTQLL